MTLPDPVIRKRFFVPLCVFCFGMAAVSPRTRSDRACDPVVVSSGER
jgi:hypothetical protein